MNNQDLIYLWKLSKTQFLNLLKNQKNQINQALKTETHIKNLSSIKRWNIEYKKQRNSQTYLRCRWIPIVFNAFKHHLWISPNWRTQKSQLMWEFFSNPNIKTSQSGLHPINILFFQFHHNQLGYSQFLPPHFYENLGPIYIYMYVCMHIYFTKQKKTEEFRENEGMECCSQS